MEIATILLQQPMESQQAVPAGSPNAMAPAPDGLFAMFFAQKLNMTDANAPVGTLLSVATDTTGEVKDGETQVEGSAQQEGGAINLPLQTAVPAELQVMAMMQMLHQSLVGQAHLPQISPEATSEPGSGELAEISSATMTPVVTEPEKKAQPSLVSSLEKAIMPAPQAQSTQPTQLAQSTHSTQLAQPTQPQLVQSTQPTQLAQTTQLEQLLQPERQEAPLGTPIVKAADAKEQKAPELNLEAQSVPTPQTDSEKQASKPVMTAHVSTEADKRKIEPLVTTVPEQQKAVAEPTKAASEMPKVAESSEVKSSTPVVGQILPHPLRGVALRAEGHQQKEPTPQVLQSGATEGAVVPELRVGQIQQGAQFSSGEQQGEQLPGEKVKEASPSSTPLAADVFKVPEQNRHQVAAQPVAEQSPVPEHEHIVAQVKEKLANHEVTPGKGEISFSLHPEELGELKITMRMEDHRLKVEIVAQNQTVRDALVQNMEGLRESLSRQSITVDRFDVSTGGGSFNEAFREGKQTGQNRFNQSYPQYGTARAEQEQKIVTNWQPREDSLVDVRF